MYSPSAAKSATTKWDCIITAVKAYDPTVQPRVIVNRSLQEDDSQIILTETQFSEEPPKTALLELGTSLPSRSEKVAVWFFSKQFVTEVPW